MITSCPVNRMCDPRAMRALAFLLLAVALRADERTRKLLDRLTQEAQAFQMVAPQVVGREQLLQKALIAAPTHIKIRFGQSATVAPKPSWEQHSVVSQYGFSALGGSPQNIHELRQVSEVDGRQVQDQQKAQDALAKAITATGDQRKKLSLMQLEKYKLHGAVTDFGQLLLLFAGANQERYEFTYAGSRRLVTTNALVFDYRQLDGPQALTVFNAAGPKAERLRVEGEIWVQPSDYALRRITLTAIGGPESAIRQEATVDYLPSDWGSVLPSAVLHQELHQGRMTVENRFTYSGFRRF
jgi:hypothetical protein